MKIKQALSTLVIEQAWLVGCNYEISNFFWSFEIGFLGSLTLFYI